MQRTTHKTVAIALCTFGFACNALAKIYLPGEERPPESPLNLLMYRIIIGLIFCTAIIVLGMFIVRMLGRVFQKKISKQ